MRFNRIFLLILAVLLCLGGCGAQGVENPPTASTPVASDTPKNEENPPLPSGNKETGDLLSRVVFVGDSTTAHMASRAAVSQTQVWATRSRYLNLSPRVTDEKILLPNSGAELTIAAAAAATRPEFLVITLGIDYGVYYYRNDDRKFAFYYEKLLDAIGDASPETTVILQSIFPVGRESAVITNEMVDKANRTVKSIAEARGLFYLDANSLLKDSEGYLASAFCSSADGIHLTAAAYGVILDNLSAHADEIAGGKL